MASEVNEQWICTALDVEGGIRPGSPIKPVMRGVAAKDKRWPADTKLKVFFLEEGPVDKQKRFMDIANLWFDDGVSLKLDQTTDIANSHIRVTFKNGFNNSLIGIDSLHPNFRTKSTLNVSDVTEDRVLHEFGHALGLLHEYSHSERNFTWIEANVYRDYKKDFNWDKSMVDTWVFEKVANMKKEEITNFDISSVMVYPMRKDWTTSNIAFPVPSKLSPGDKATIRKLYPA
jgi:hypothetical protein